MTLIEQLRRALEISESDAQDPLYSAVEKCVEALEKRVDHERDCPDKMDETDECWCGASQVRRALADLKAAIEKVNDGKL